MGALGAFALLYDGEGRILLCHRRDADVWNLPGGQVERGETPWQAAIRETREETGLEASVRRLTFVDHRPERDELVFTFAAVVAVGDELALNDEVDQLAWFAPSELPANIAPRHAERIIPVLVTSGPPMLRVQPGPGIRESLLAHDDSRSRFTNREFRLGAFATVLNERGSVLLGLRWDADFWGQPGGVEPNETPWDAVVREIHEETEIMAYVERLAGIYCWPEQDELIFSFLCTAIGESLQTSDETRAVRFFAPDTLPPNLLQEHRQRLLDALNPRPDQETLLVIPDALSAPDEIHRWRTQR